MKANSDPPKTTRVGPRAISSSNPQTKRQLEHQKAREQQKKSTTIIPEQSITKEVTRFLSDDKRAARYVKGMGIKKIEINRKTNAIEFELEEEFNHILSTICSWKKIKPEEYLSQLLTEYFLSLKHKK